MIEEYLDIITGLHALGLSYNDIAKSLGLNPMSLHSYRTNHRESFPRERNYRFIDDEESKEIFDEYMTDGMTQKDISEKHKVCPKTVNRHIQQQMLLRRTLGR